MLKKPLSDLAIASMLILGVLMLGGGLMFASSVSTSPKPRIKTLTDAAATGYATVSIQPGNAVSGVVHWQISATDGTAIQTRTADTYFTAVNDGRLCGRRCRDDHRGNAHRHPYEHEHMHGRDREIHSERER
jgi:hypothetical protein